MLLAYHLSQINKEDILQYKLDRLRLAPDESLDSTDGIRAASRSTSHIVQLHRRLQRHLEERTITLLADCADLDPVEIDTNRIAADLEACCLENSSISLRRLKGMLYTGMQHFRRLPACLHLLLELKDNKEEPAKMTPPPKISPAPKKTEKAERVKSVKSAKRTPRRKKAEPVPAESSSDYSMETEEEDMSEDDIVSDSPSTPSVEMEPEKPEVSRVVTDRFEFAEIDEQDLVTDILFVIQGLEGRFIKRDKHGRFSLTSERKVSKGVRQLTNRICSLGQLYNSIINAALPSGIITHTLYQAVMDQIHQYNRLVNLLTSGRNNEPLNLRQLYVWVQQPYTRMRLLAVALDGAHGFSVDRIFTLYCSRGDAMGRELYNELLRKCMIPYLEVLLNWIYFGELQDSSGMFFVKKSKDRYKLSPSKVPKFIPSPLALACYEVGRCGSYCTQLKSKLHMKGEVDVPRLINQLCEEGPSWSIYVTAQRLGDIVRSIDSSKQLAQILINEHSLLGYIDRIKSHLALEHLVEDPDSEVFDDFEITKDYGFDIYVPKFNFPLNLILEDEKLNRETYIRNFRLNFLLERTLKVLSICWSEYSWNSRLSKGSLDLSRRLNWINICRNEMSHFCHVLQSGRNTQFLLERFTSPKGVTSVSPLTLRNIQEGYSALLSSMQPGNFLEVMEILECIVDYCKLVPRLFNKGAMQQLSSLVRDRQTPASIVDFIHNNIATSDMMKVLAHHAHRFRENVMLLLTTLAKQDADRRRFGAIVDYNHFYRLISVVET
ncbi:gamma tubulin complex like protein [Babesia gibsoni]|uniref:Gamma tubulin complex like protein n=1 Tax=Babesia gibsoni TaxID=33632 RepID=A0AAD8LP21_BABGI|nr:gamma tubulin complex like protein [Babesia gibsoni]